MCAGALHKNPVIEIDKSVICQLSIKLHPLVTSSRRCTPVGPLLSLGGESSATVDQLDLDQLLVHHGGHHPL